MKTSKNHSDTLVSKRDRKLFFDTIFSDREPNRRLKEAAQNFNQRQKEGPEKNKRDQ